ncbi:MAG: O-antigen ligase family protein [Desulfobulbaceae bacterium]|nr:O-antigen ligase family protein [Desulfobulbaceae bacterium]
MEKKHHIEWGEMPWWLYGVILVIFAYTIPFELNRPLALLDYSVWADPSSALERMSRGNVQRQAAMVALSGLGILNFLRPSRKPLVVKGPLGWTILFYLSWVMLSVIWATDTIFTAKRVLIILLLWIGAVSFAERYSLEKIFGLAIFITLSTILIAIGNELRLGTFDPLDENWRLSGMIHAIQLGWNCGLLMLVSMGMTRKTGKWPGRVLKFLFLLAFVSLMLTKSRMALISAMAGIFVYGFCFVSNINKILAGLALVVIVCLATLFEGEKLWQILQEASTMGRGGVALEMTGSFSGRTYLWMECIKDVADSPIWGYGYNSFLGPVNISRIADRVGWTPNSPHSAYIDTLVGLGIVGISALLMYLFLAFKKVIGLMKKNDDYVLILGVLVWWVLNAALEADPITRPVFPNFFCLILLSKMAFIPGDEEPANDANSGYKYSYSKL